MRGVLDAPHGPAPAGGARPSAAARLGGDLDAFVLSDELERLLQRQLALGDQPRESSDVDWRMFVELLLLRRVHVHVLRAGVLPDDHALVDLLARPYEHRPALLERLEREPGRHPAAVGHERTGRPRSQIAVPRLVSLEHMVELTGSAGLGQELRPEPDKAARRDQVLHPDPPRAVVHHVLQPPLPEREQLRDDAQVLLGRVDRHPLDRLVERAVDGPRHDLGLAHGQLEPLAAHHLDQHRQLELTPTLNLPAIGAVRRRAPGSTRCRRSPDPGGP